jgi:hypothetical protein
MCYLGIRAGLVAEPCPPLPASMVLPLLSAPQTLIDLDLK